MGEAKPVGMVREDVLDEARYGSIQTSLHHTQIWLLLLIESGWENMSQCFRSLDKQVQPTS